jgi:hypothetical protein
MITEPQARATGCSCIRKISRAFGAPLTDYEEVLACMRWCSIRLFGKTQILVSNNFYPSSAHLYSLLNA